MACPPQADLVLGWVAYRACKCPPTNKDRSCAAAIYPQLDQHATRVLGGCCKKIGPFYRFAFGLRQVFMPITRRTGLRWCLRSHLRAMSKLGPLSGVVDGAVALYWPTREESLVFRSSGNEHRLQLHLHVKVGVEGISELRKIMLSALLRVKCRISSTHTCYHTPHDHVQSSDPLIGVILQEQSRLRGRGTLLRSSTTAWVAAHQVSQGKEGKHL